MNRHQPRGACPELQVREAARRQRFDVWPDAEICIAAAAEEKLPAEARGKVGGGPNMRSVAVSGGADTQRGTQLRRSFDASRADDRDGACPRVRSRDGSSDTVPAPCSQTASPPGRYLTKQPLLIEIC